MKFSLLGILLLAISSAANAATLTLPDYTTNAYQYGDFYSYSVALLKYQNLLSADDLSVLSSAPGQIKNLPVLATGSHAASTTPVGMDNAYSTSPSQSTVSSLFTTYSTPTGLGTDLATGKGLIAYDVDTWDINLSSLRSFLTDSTGKTNDLVVLFDNNQSQNDASPQLQAYGQIVIWSSTNPSLMPIVFDFVNTNNNGGLPGGTGAFIYTSSGVNYDPVITNTDYVTVPNTVTGTNIPSNVGTNIADFVLFSPELNALITDLSALSGYTTVSFFVDFGNRTAGNEQIYLANATVSPTIPEPTTMLLVGIGTMAVAFIRRRA